MDNEKNLFLSQCSSFSHFCLHFSPPSRWPDVPKRKSKKSQCSVKSMSGKDLSSPQEDLASVQCVTLQLAPLGSFRINLAQ